MTVVLNIPIRGLGRVLRISCNMGLTRAACVCVPVIYVVQPVQQEVNITDVQLTFTNGLQPPGNSLMVALQVHLSDEGHRACSKLAAGLSKSSVPTAATRV